MSKQKTLGQFFTTGDWLTSIISLFITEATFSKVVDPFAGKGNLLEPFTHYDSYGYDIDPTLSERWTVNDSLVGIPENRQALCVTNPPYLASYTAKRYKRQDALKHFADNPEYDLYLIAIRKCLEAFDWVIAIVPETYLLTGLFRDRLVLANILEKSPFDDTDFPVVVCCWGKEKEEEFLVYKNDNYVGTWKQIQMFVPSAVVNDLFVSFNRVDGQLGLIGIDGTKDDTIRFCDVTLIGAEEIKVSSRLRTRIRIDYPHEIDIFWLQQICNETLLQIRKNTQDIVFAPFKGNRKNGKRRRRLDYKIAKRIIHHAVWQMRPTTV